MNVTELDREFYVYKKAPKWTRPVSNPVDINRIVNSHATTSPDSNREYAVRDVTRFIQSARSRGQWDVYSTLHQIAMTSDQEERRIVATRWMRAFARHVFRMVDGIPLDGPQRHYLRDMRRKARKDARIRAEVRATYLAIGVDWKD